LAVFDESPTTSVVLCCGNCSSDRWCNLAFTVRLFGIGMVAGTSNGCGLLPVDSERSSMSEEVSRIASKFLHEYLRQNPQAQFHPVQCPSRTHDIGEDSEQTAVDFLSRIQQLQSRGPIDSEQRIEITEPSSVIILRKGRPVRFLAGFRHRDSKPVWCYDARLAAAVSVHQAEELVKALRIQGVETFTMPAPEKRYGSL
jgi:hypothetical protein